MDRRLTVMWVCLGALFFCGAAQGGIIDRVKGYVQNVDLSDPTAPVVVLRPINAPDRMGDRLALRVPFTTSPEGCIDWSDPGNRSRAFVLSLEPGHVVRAYLPFVKSGTASPILVKRIFYMAASSDAIFPGCEKIADPGVISAFQPAPVRIPVIVTLATGEDLAAKMADPDASRAAAADLKQIRVRLRTDLPEDDFEVAEVLENAPVIMGTVNLAGLKALAAHPLVAAIEPDRSMTLSEPAAGAFETAPAGGDAETAPTDMETEGKLR